MRLHSSNAEETREIASVVAGFCRAGDTVLLSGEMGAGKTVFAQGFGVAVGVRELITSPTFTLVNSHPAEGVTLHHADLYRLDRTAEIADLALAELAELDGIVIVEWGEVTADDLPGHLAVHIEPGDPDDSEDVRCIELSARGDRWAARWDRLSERLGVFRGEAC
ncbi:MAG: tRNA (adenosine(37)-N6)-threonylcarbamoyltransferase complex ATPase subunit type 1 TsaE [Ilumatobacteraceae bacterium]